MDLLVVGGDGLIGRALVEAARARGLKVLATSRRKGAGDLQLDLARPATWSDLPPASAMVITAAVARLGQVEADAPAAALVNVGAAGLMAARARAAGAWCLYLSSDKVFDGAIPLRARSDAPCPGTEYGRQKAQGEAAVQAAGGAILRLSKVLAPDLALLDQWRARLLAGEGIEPFSNLRLAPVTCEGVVGLILGLAALREGGIFHYTGAADRPYADLALALARRLDADPSLVRPMPAPPGIAAGILVPHSSLEMDRERALFGFANPPFEEVVDRVFARLL